MKKVHRGTKNKQNKEQTDKKKDNKYIKGTSE